MKKFVGRWRIKRMETWDQDFVDMVEPGYFRFEKKGAGAFVFGAVQGEMDCRVLDGGERIEYSWIGSDDGHEQSGRGWFQLHSAHSAKGKLFIHDGDDSAVEIEREK